MFQILLLARLHIYLFVSSASIRNTNSTDFRPRVLASVHLVSVYKIVHYTHLDSVRLVEKRTYFVAVLLCTGI